MIKIIESRKDFGSMNIGTISPVNLTEEDKKILARKYNIDIKELESYDIRHDKEDIFNLHRKNLGNAMGFDGNHMFMALQNDKKGSFFEITRDYVEANPEGWTDIPEDILVITSNLPKVVIGHPVADCPVVMMTDRRQKISVIGHCSADMIDRRLPTMIGEVLRSTYGSRAEDIYAYVSACVGDNWTYDQFPRWARDEHVWNRCISYGEDGKFHIRLRPAVLKQILAVGLSSNNIHFNMDNTDTNNDYYSHSVSEKNGRESSPKFGRHFAGIFFEDEDSDEITVQKGRGK